jgi:hypothetical protein
MSVFFKMTDALFYASLGTFCGTVIAEITHGLAQRFDKQQYIKIFVIGFGSAGLIHWINKE